MRLHYFVIWAYSLKVYTQKYSHTLVNAHLNSKLIAVGTEKNQQWPKRESPGLYLEAPLSEGTLPPLFHSRLCVLSCSVMSDSAAPWTVASQAPLSTEFIRQEYWSGLPFPPPQNLPNTGIKPTSLSSPALAPGFFTTSTTWEAFTLRI